MRGVHSLVLLLSLVSACFAGLQTAPWVETSTARIQGFINTSYTPNVAQYLGIPFAEPPLGPLRFVPPVPKDVQGDFNATTRQPSCSQWFTKLPNIFDLTPELVPPEPYAEDCLYLNVFAPAKNCSQGSNLPVVVWIHGGALTWGGTNTPGEFPMRWVERSGEHIVVQINYRVNAFGYPNAGGLRADQQNAGVKDARLALEWVRGNIKHFGGDPNHIILHGHSAGAAMIGVLELGYPSDPIAKGLIQQSGVASMLNGTASDPDHRHDMFTTLAKNLGCANQTAEEELDCMRSVDQQRIEDFLQQYTDAKTMPALTFAPTADGELVFEPQEYVEKYSSSKLPAIIGFTAQEGSSFIPYTSPENTGATESAIQDFTLWEIQCAILTAIQQRSAGGSKTFPFLYSGNFTNISPEPWMGAYHFAELPITFGVHEDLEPSSTKYEYDVSHVMQDLWLAFIKDPENGALSRGWPLYKPNGQVLNIAPSGSDQPTVLDMMGELENECSTTPPLA